MVFEPDEKMKKKMSKDGSVLKFMYSVAGLGKGLTAAGGMLAGIGVLLGVVFQMTLEMEMIQILMFAGAFVIPGILLVLGGVKLQKVREDKWLKKYEKNTGLPEAEILKADQEFREPGTILFSFEKQKDTNSLKKMGFITKHYIKMPGIGTSMARIEDMVACFYTNKFRCQDGGYDKAFMAYSNDKKMTFLNTSIKEKDAVEIVQVIVKRNPSIIHDHHFMYENKEYDAARDMDEVIALHNQVTGAGKS